MKVRTKWVAGYVLAGVGLAMFGLDIWMHRGPGALSFSAVGVIGAALAFGSILVFPTAREILKHEPKKE